MRKKRLKRLVYVVAIDGKFLGYTNQFTSAVSDAKHFIGRETAIKQIEYFQNKFPRFERSFRLMEYDTFTGNKSYINY